MTHTHAKDQGQSKGTRLKIYSGNGQRDGRTEVTALPPGSRAKVR